MNIEQGVATIKRAIGGDGLVYLACPYTHVDPAVQQYRFELATRATANLAQQGLHIFSPLTHSHPLAQMADLPGDWDFWKRYDELFLKACRGLIVLTAPGWGESVGVLAEMDIASPTPDDPIWYMCPQHDLWPRRSSLIKDQRIDWRIA